MGEYSRKSYQTTFSKGLPHQIKLKKTSNGLDTVTIKKKKMEGLWVQKQRLETFYSSAA
jgi:hypothetical protein